MRIKIFDINSFLIRMNYTHSELAEKVGLKTSSVSVWASTEQKPSFKICLKLLELGMTFEELFGTELTGKTQMWLNEDKNKVPEINEDDFERKVCEVLIKHLSGGAKL